MNAIKLTKEDAAEVIHKLSILADEPELQEDYQLNQEQATELLESVPWNGGEWTIPTWGAKAAAEELENHAEILRGIAHDARRGREAGQALRLDKQAKRFEEKLIPAIKQMQPVTA